MMTPSFCVQEMRVDYTLNFVGFHDDTMADFFFQGFIGVDGFSPSDPSLSNVFWWSEDLTMCVSNTWAKSPPRFDPHMTPAKELDLSLWDKKFWLEIINLIRGLSDTFWINQIHIVLMAACSNDQ